MKLSKLKLIDFGFNDIEIKIYIYLTDLRHVTGNCMWFSVLIQMLNLIYTTISIILICTELQLVWFYFPSIYQSYFML